MCVLCTSMYWFWNVNQLQNIIIVINFYHHQTECFAPLIVVYLNIYIYSVASTHNHRSVVCVHVSQHFPYKQTSIWLYICVWLKINSSLRWCLPFSFSRSFVAGWFRFLYNISLSLLNGECEAVFSSYIHTITLFV